MGKNRKNCLNCAFCMRNKNKFISFGIMSSNKPFWHYHSESLSDKEREMLKQNNDQFIGEDKRAYENWIFEYNKKKAKYKNRVYQNTIELKNNLSSTGDNALSIIKNQYGDYKKYGIKEPCPNQYNDEDYLSCWKQCWNESKNQDLIQNRSNLNKYKCSYFYDYADKNNKTLELCNEERKEKIDRNRFLLTITLTILTFIVALITLLITV